MKYPVFICAMLMVFSFWPTLAQAELREWSSSDGKFKVEAELIGFDGKHVKLKKVNGLEINVPTTRLSKKDLEYLESRKKDFLPAQAPKADLPIAVERFRKSMESMRDVEAKRLEKRIDQLKRELEQAKKAKPAAPKAGAGTTPPGFEERMKRATEAVEGTLRKEAAAQEKANEKEVAALIKKLGQRLELINSGKPFLPRLSPKDFAVGQIGELDDDLLLSLLKSENKEATISVMFEEWKCLPNFMQGKHVPLNLQTVSRPDKFYLRGDLVGSLVDAEKGHERNSPTNRLLRKRHFEIVEKIPRGAASDYVLVPFEMDAVLVWLNDEEEREFKK